MSALPNKFSAVEKDNIKGVPIIKPTLAEMEKCIARFNKLERCSTGIPDMALPECTRTFFNVLGFSKTQSSVGGKSSLSATRRSPPYRTFRLDSAFLSSAFGRARVC